VAWLQHPELGYLPSVRDHIILFVLLDHFVGAAAQIDVFEKLPAYLKRTRPLDPMINLSSNKSAILICNEAAR
jgi:hypothetical protein